VELSWHDLWRATVAERSAIQALFERA